MLKILKKIIPAKLLDLNLKRKYSKRKSPFSGLTTETVFQQIFESNYWGSKASISGAGSSENITEKLALKLHRFMESEDIGSIIDIPCGDFNWMQQIDLSGKTYIGCDIVKQLIDQNNQKYANDHIQFKRLNIIRDPLPVADLILNRDCLVHFSYQDIFDTLENVKSSGCRYFASTTFRSFSLNYDIITGDWRPLNLEIKPFHLPKPFHRFDEYCPEGLEKECRGKVLGIWRVADLV